MEHARCKLASLVAGLDGSLMMMVVYGIGPRLVKLADWKGDCLVLQSSSPEL
jgi:hypothetical protein